MMLNALAIQSGGGERIPEISTLLLELERVGAPVVDGEIHYVTYVRMAGAETLRLMWSGPALPVSAVQAISRRFARAVFTLAGLSETGEPVMWRVVNGVDVAKVVEASGLADGEKEQS